MKSESTLETDDFHKKIIFDFVSFWIGIKRLYLENGKQSNMDESCFDISYPYHTPMEK